LNRSLQEEICFMYNVGVQKPNGLYLLKLMGAGVSAEMSAELSLQMYLKGEWIPNFYSPEEYNNWIQKSSDGSVMACNISDDYDYETFPFKSPFKTSIHSNKSSSSSSSSKFD
jgi:hypothetical protein